MMTKTLRFWNGNERNNALYVAAYSVAEACRLLNGVGYITTRHGFMAYWSEAWGTSMQAKVGQPTEPCVWVQPKGEQVPVRLFPASGEIIQLSGSDPLRPAPALCIKLAKLVRYPSDAVWHDGDVQNWLRQMKNLGHL